MHVDERELGNFLLDARLLSRPQLDALSAQAQERGVALYTVLAGSASVPEDELRRAVAHVSGVPFVMLSHENISKDALLLIPEPVARAHSVAAFRLHGATVAVMLLSLDDLSAVEFLEKEGYRVSPHLTDRASLKRALMLEQKLLKERFADHMKSTSHPSDAADALLSHALLSRASDIHLEERRVEWKESELLVRYRIHGMLQDALVLSKQGSGIITRFKELAKLSLTLMTAQEGRFKIALGIGEKVSVIVSYMPVFAGERMTLHLSPEREGRKGFTFESLGFHGNALSEVYRSMRARSGLVLIATPKHSLSQEHGYGRTSTLYTAIDFLSSPHLSIATLERRIDLPLPQVAQTLIRPEIGLGSAQALRAILKQDPDAVFIDDISDTDTAALAFSAAARGVFVVAGIDAASSAKAAEKLQTLSLPPALVASTLKAVIGQRVVRKLCDHCKNMAPLTRARIAPLETHADFGRVLAHLKEEGIAAPEAQWKEVPFGQAVGCDKCKDGFDGYIGLQEVLPITAQMKELLLAEVAAKDIHKEAHKDSPLGTILNVAEDGIFKAAQGKTTLEEVFEAIQ